MEDTYERDFWGDCTNTLGEERKQFAYARHMGVDTPGLNFDAYGASVLDLGGGPVSMLLKTVNRGACRVMDPGDAYWPTWVHHRYGAARIDVDPRKAEELDLGPTFTEAWIYNCLQHVDDPEKIIANARRACGRIRIFEWVDLPACEGHPHELKAVDLARWLGNPTPQAQQFYIDENGATGQAFAGVFGV